MAAATGNPLDPQAQIAEAASKVLIAGERGRTRRSEARWGVLGSGVGYYFGYKGAQIVGDTIKGVADTSGDINIGSIRQSNSSHDEGLATAGPGGSGSGATDGSTGNGGVGGAGTGGTNSSGTRTNTLIIGERNSNGTAFDNGRLGVTSDGPSLINDTSGTQSTASDSKIQGQTVADENNGSTEVDDDDGFNL